MKPSHSYNADVYQKQIQERHMHAHFRSLWTQKAALDNKSPRSLYTHPKGLHRREQKRLKNKQPIVLQQARLSNGDLALHQQSISASPTTRNIRRAKRQYKSMDVMQSQFYEFTGEQFRPRTLLTNFAESKLAKMTRVYQGPINLNKYAPSKNESPAAEGEEYAKEEFESDESNDDDDDNYSEFIDSVNELVGDEIDMDDDELRRVLTEKIIEYANTLSQRKMRQKVNEMFEGLNLSEEGDQIEQSSEHSQSSSSSNASRSSDSAEESSVEELQSVDNEDQHHSEQDENQQCSRHEESTSAQYSVLNEDIPLESLDLSLDDVESILNGEFEYQKQKKVAEQRLAEPQTKSRNKKETKLNGQAAAAIMTIPKQESPIHEPELELTGADWEQELDKDATAADISEIQDDSPEANNIPTTTFSMPNMPNVPGPTNIKQTSYERQSFESQRSQSFGATISVDQSGEGDSNLDENDTVPDEADEIESPPPVDEMPSAEQSGSSIASLQPDAAEMPSPDAISNDSQSQSQSTTAPQLVDIRKKRETFLSRLAAGKVELK